VPGLLRQCAGPLLVGVVFEEISGVGGDSGHQPPDRIRLLCPVRVEGSDGSGEKALDVDADLGPLQRHRATAGVRRPSPAGWGCNASRTADSNTDSRLLARAGPTLGHNSSIS
jgi:hypothetical protein